MEGSCQVLYIYLMAVLAAQTHGYRPVVLIHGAFANGTSGPTQILEWILQNHPGTVTYSIDMFNGYQSLTRLSDQIKVIGKKLEPVNEKHKEGFNLIGYSQGGIISRGLLQQFPFNVDTFISLSAPLAGVYGRSFLRPYLPKWLEKVFYLFAYTKFFQMFAPCNYWNDPYQQALYRKYSEFLAIYNNDTANPMSHEFKRNFLRLRKLVLIGGPDDGVIDPWQSSQFGFYTGDEVTDMRKQMFYQTDAFGLRTLDQQGRLHSHIMAGVHHHGWYTNKTVFQKFILPYLT